MNRSRLHLLVPALLGALLSACNAPPSPSTEASSNPANPGETAAPVVKTATPAPTAAAPGKNDL
ncbi:MAG: hypothetical protein ABI134_21885, partial [Byssovorax sp.]